MEVVTAAELPKLTSVSIKGAAQALGPEDELDRRAQYGEKLEKSDEAVLAKRRGLIVAAALRVARAAGVGEETIQQLGQLRPEHVDAWLLRAGLTEKRGSVTVKDENGVQHAKPVILRATGSEARKSAYYAALAIRAEYPSKGAAMLRQVANCAARAIEAANAREGGAAHALLAGMIGQA